MHSGSSSGSDAVSGPIRRVLLISAGASHSVALLCKYSQFPTRVNVSIVNSWGGVGVGVKLVGRCGLFAWTGMLHVTLSVGFEWKSAWISNIVNITLSEGYFNLQNIAHNEDDVICASYNAAGSVVCSWGRGEDGQLGHGDAEDRFSPTQLSALDGQGIVSVTSGADHTTAYSESQLQVYSWGWGDFGRLGHGNSSDLFTPQPIKALQGLRIKQIACGDSHCLAVTMEGEVQSWGRNQNGQLGLGSTEDSLVPRKIEAFQGISVKMVAAGAEHTAAVTEDGQLYGWGWGRYGNLGLGDRDDRLVPGKVSTIQGEKMVLVACGWRHTISVSSSGSLYTYGWSKYGQLGHGDFEDHLIPHKLEALRENRISQISGGWRHTMAVTDDGKLFGWGWNKFGQVGVGNNVDHCSPVQVKFPLDQ
ncbi:UNVERIFIED_CONTAM: Ultraviolet-B receptor UVR8, partial [Sesamum radiatum]